MRRCTRPAFVSEYESKLRKCLKEGQFGGSKLLEGRFAERTSAPHLPQAGFRLNRYLQCLALLGNDFKYSTRSFFSHWPVPGSCSCHSDLQRPAEWRNVHHGRSSPSCASIDHSMVTCDSDHPEHGWPGSHQCRLRQRCACSILARSSAEKPVRFAMRLAQTYARHMPRSPSAVCIRYDCLRA
jgi:hypothetical protein